jgi:hypothetical protein
LGAPEWIGHGFTSKPSTSNIQHHAEKGSLEDGLLIGSAQHPTFKGWNAPAAKDGNERKRLIDTFREWNRHEEVTISAARNVRQRCFCSWKSDHPEAA